MSRRYVSPLRYPGGKARLAPFLARVLAAQGRQIETYCEPYAGGAGAGLHLLSEGHVSKLIINDLNPGIAAFWTSVFSHNEEFIGMIEECRVSLDEWRRQREIYCSPDGQEVLTLGFATFFLNRTNRSGILSARPIGGLEQKGKWKIGARFNKTELIERIARLGMLSPFVDVRNVRAIELIQTLNRRKHPVLLYVDPPYVVPGEELYMTEHSWDEHRRLARVLGRSPHYWLLTYDADERTQDLYRGFRCLSFAISHTAQQQRVGRELMFFGRRLRVPDQQVMGQPGCWVFSDNSNT